MWGLGVVVVLVGDLVVFVTYISGWISGWIAGWIGCTHTGSVFFSRDDTQPARAVHGVLFFYPLPLARALYDRIPATYTTAREE